MESVTMVAPMPVWIRLPKAGEHEYFTGMTRTPLAKLCQEGKVEFRRVGVGAVERRAIHVRLQSVLHYIEEQKEDSEG